MSLKQTSVEEFKRLFAKAPELKEEAQDIISRREERGLPLSTSEQNMKEALNE